MSVDEEKSWLSLLGLGGGGLTLLGVLRYFWHAGSAHNEIINKLDQNREAIEQVRLDMAEKEKRDDKRFAEVHGRLNDHDRVIGELVGRVDQSH